MDQIRIRNLKIFAYHGVYEQEKEQGQNFCVNAVLYTDTEKAGKSDDIADAVDYGAACLFIDNYMRENRFDLLEAVTRHVAEELLLAFPAIRKVELEGEGYFRVAHNEDMPFIVLTKRLDVLVLGTRFDVRSYSTDDIVSVSVESGKVQVDLPEAMMRLTAKEQVLINTVSGEYSKKKEERGVAVWIKGSLRFNSTPIRDVAKELERVYNCQITFASGQEFDNLITGEHDNKSLESVLKSIEFISDINYKKEGRNILLYKK